MLRNDAQMKYIVSDETTIVDAMQKIDANAKGILFVADEKCRLIGSVTDGDIRRWLIKTGKLSAKVADLMNCNPKSLPMAKRGNAMEFMRRFKITSVPLVNATGKIEDILFDDMPDLSADAEKGDVLRNIPVIIMAGGKGTRLYPYTKILPKPLIPIGDIPIVERIINRFCEYGISEYYMTVNYKKEMIKSYFTEMNPNYLIHYVEEDRPLGTAGSIRLIRTDFRSPVIITNCDILIDADYADILEFHETYKNDMTIVSSLKNIILPYGVLHCKEKGIVTSMEEKPKFSCFVNTGMYILNPEFIRRIPEDTFFNMTDLADILIRDGARVGTYPVSEESFLDMGEFEEMRRMEERLNLSKS